MKVVVICDNRLVTRPYGEVFLNSLLPSPRTRDLTKAIAFLQARQFLKSSGRTD
ncbi:hypothetical protein [Photorhabdus asymbiotica]|uniref:hypothetical protein n=1 Tax=Photorhabdus asymbiotica TaxID=291112 RepID=UPI003DA79A6F